MGTRIEEGDAHLTRSPYPKDDYHSGVDFSLARPVMREDVFLVCFNEIGIEVACNQLHNHPTKVLIHGWLTSIEKSPWYTILKDAYLTEPTPINVIYVDYGAVASKRYSIASASYVNVGRILACHLMETRVDPTNMHLIGHSLGSHVASAAARAIYNSLGVKVQRITLLDPAGPKFDSTPGIINSGDATFVDVIHTDDGHYGLKRSVGHVDFYPSGGSDQPGVPPHDEDDNASHARANIYFIESVKHKPKISRKASTWADFLAGNFLDNEPAVFGEYASHSLRGNYYFVPNTHAPFLSLN